MRVLVTGAAGFIGTHVCRDLVDRGVDVVGIDCFLADSYDAGIKRVNAEALRREAGVVVLEADIREPLPGQAWDGVEGVVNLAAMPGLMKSWSDFSVYESCNLTGVQRLVEESLRRGVEHFVQISTSSVYGTLATGTEADPLQPISPYGVTKLAGEKLVAAYGASQGLPFTVLRYFSVYGPGQRPDMAYHIICERILDDISITVYGDGLQSRSNTYVSDVAEATSLAVTAPARGLTLNVAGGEGVGLLDAIAVLEAELGRSARLEFAAPRPGDQRHTRGDWSAAHDSLGYSPLVTVGDGLARQARWHRERRA